jgi:uncharacterized protein (TIGR02145 family)
MRQKDLKYFGDPQSGRLNADDSPFAITTHEWVNAENVRTGSTDNGATAIMESVGGNALIPEPDDLVSVVIGDQTWSVYNLDVTTYRNGDPIPEVTNSTAWSALTSGAWCWYNNDSNTGIKLYNWYAVNDPRGLAPWGWRLPTGAEWTTLSSFLGGDSVSGGKLKEIGTTNWNAPNTGATNQSGFTALPDGQRSNTGTFSLKGQQGIFWTTDADPLLNQALRATLSYNSAALSFNAVTQKQFGFSVRVIRNNSQYITIGSVEDPENNRFIYFNKDIAYNDDKIVCCYTDTNTQYNVLLSSQVNLGLNFSKDSLIHSARIANGILSWPDSTNNEPRKINIEAGIKANHPSFVTDIKPYDFPLEFSLITLIKPPPIYVAQITKNQDTSFLNNFIANESFQFAFQYQYYDEETTVIGEYSQSSRLNGPSDTYNRITVSMSFSNFIQSTVQRISLIVRSSETNFAFIARTWDKANPDDLNEIENHNNQIGALTYQFYNNIVGEVIAENDVLRPFDSVPIYSQTHEVAKQRYFLGNNIDGYSTPSQSSLTLGIGGYINPGTTTRSAALIEIKHVGNDWVGYFPYIGPTYQWYTYTGWYVYLSWATPRGYYLCNGYDAINTQFYIPPGYPTVTPPTTIAFSNITFKGATLDQVVQNTKPSGYRSLNSAARNNQAPPITITGVTNPYYNAFPQLSNYSAGIAFYDYAMRKCGVVANGRNTLSENRTIEYYHSGSNYGFNVYTVIDLLPGDTFTVAGLSAGNGTYVVQSIISTTPGSFIIVVIGTVPSFTTGTGSITWNQDSTVSTPQRNFAYTSAVDSFIWNVTNVNSVDEIPDWAYYYAPLLTKNTTKRFFINAYSNELKYATRNPTGEYVYTSTIFTQQAVAIAINTTILNQSQLGYVFAPEDVCILTRDDDSYWELPVIGQDGDYILLKCQDIGDFANRKFIYEIYSPYKTSNEEPYYEVGQLYRINDPGLITRTYSQLFGYFNADAYILQRSVTVTYLASAMAPNDLYYKNWYTDSGKSNVVTKLGQVDNTTEVLWSDTYVSGTQINGSSTFRLGAQTFVSDTCGAITKLQNTSKVQEQGSVMLALCVKQANSMYLGETQITDSTGAVKFFSPSTEIISTINILKGDYGCINPESVNQYRGNVYFFDANNGRWVQYSLNGLDNISAIKMNRFWKNWAYKYKSLTTAEIEAFGDRPYVFSIVDPAHDELLISIPKLSNVPPKGFLPDYPSQVYPFDILDYQGKTMVYSLGTLAGINPHWQSAYTFTTEYFVTMHNRLFSFKNGLVWEHNQAYQNYFYNTLNPSRVMFTSNVLPQTPKVYDNFVSESNIIPNFVYFYNEFPYLQTSDLVGTDFIQLEGIWYANILRNKVVPTVSGNVYTGLLTAEVMRNTNMYVLAEYFPTSEPLQLRLIQLGLSISKGHTI